MSEWQPIETAPKDCRILGVDAGCDVFICWWQEKYFCGVLQWGWTSDHCEDFGGFEEPTHWMPLPAPPGGTK